MFDFYSQPKTPRSWPDAARECHAADVDARLYKASSKKQRPSFAAGLIARFWRWRLNLWPLPARRGGVHSPSLPVEHPAPANR